MGIGDRRGPWWVVLAVIGTCWLTAGCASTKSSVQPVGRSAGSGDPAAAPAHDSTVVFPERMSQGYTLVLPGAGGDASIDHGLIVGLKEANVPTAVELYDWTSSTHWVVQNLRDLNHNRQAALEIADKIVHYRQRYPGRPLHLVGYSGGGGVAVLALECLPEDCPVTSTTLLAPTLANDYDLRLAMTRSERGICNFYSPLDGPVLMLLCTMVGTTEGRHQIPAGAIGFRPPDVLKPHEREAYQARLVQHEYDTQMLADGHIGGHFGWVIPSFIARHIAPLVENPSPDVQTAANPVLRR